MKKIAFALALSLAATSAFAQKVGDNVTNLAPAGTTGAVGTSVVIAGVGTATWAVVAGVLLLVLVASAGSNTTTN
jgi:hypothetical protein